MCLDSTVPDSVTLLQQLAGNPQVVQQMLQAPYMPTIMEGLAKNPHWAQQVSCPRLFCCPILLATQNLKLHLRYFKITHVYKICIIYKYLYILYM